MVHERLTNFDEFSYIFLFYRNGFKIIPFLLLIFGWNLADAELKKDFY